MQCCKYALKPASYIFTFFYAFLANVGLHVLFSKRIKNSDNWMIMKYVQSFRYRAHTSQNSYTFDNEDDFHMPSDSRESKQVCMMHEAI